MTKWRIRLSSEAEADFTQILTYTRDTFGERQARLYQDILIDAVEELADGPDIFRSVARDEILPHLRSLHIASPAILRGDHGWLPLLGSERGNIRLKGIWLRRPPRNLKVDLNTLTSNSEFLGELSLIQAASGRKMLAEMSSNELSALRDTLLKIDCLDDILRNSLQDIVGYQEAFETYRLKESAIRVASEQAKLSGSVDGRMTRIRQLIDGKNQAVNTRLANALETLSRCYT